MHNVTLVSGAGRGAGLGVARVLAARGGVVYVSDLDPESSSEAARQVTELGATGISIPCDFSDEDAVGRLFGQIDRDHAGLGLLVNTVGWIDPSGPIAEMTTATWHKSFSTNIDSVFFTTRAALRTMIPRGEGVIINISSLNGTRGFPDRASYAASKAALINFTQSTAMENREFGIRANAIVPGAIAGERVRLLRERRAASGEMAPPPTVNPPIELLEPEWMGRYVAFLASDEGRYINGQSLVVGEASRTPLQSVFADL